ncbi:protein bicaudal C-like protein 1-like isoform X2 [Hibiscus syriacus]|uniref:Protein bicaudal C-like protein 1-like isoform X2 n=1 Tax=Hibiscus syriacus TaxID=106335 RepID=A0A6A2YST5_HIBSY|nr:protein bicaudal C-like protein 1-like isoform X2 [Hibiscus syriacus]
MAKLRVTFTRAGSNKVVKKGDDAIAGHGRMKWNKRFLHDKPWRNVGNKRHRTDGAERRSNGIRGQGFSRIAPGKDLRFKLMRKHGIGPNKICNRTGITRNSIAASSTIVLDPSMESGPVPDIEKAIISRPVTYVAPMSSILQIKPHFDEEPFTVSTLLNTLGLGKYAVHFMAEEVDMTALRQMGDRDLKELGIPMGPRKKLLLALRPYSRRHLPRIIRL